jgi:hypothetical protein
LCVVGIRQLTLFSGILSYPASPLPENYLNCYRYAPDFVLFPAFFPTAAVRRFRRRTC